VLCPEEEGSRTMAFGKLVVLADPQISRIEVEDIAEPLVNLRSRPEFLIDDRKIKDSQVLAFVRAGVARRLLIAQGHLPPELRLVVVEGLRPLALQASYFAQYQQELRARYPQWSEARLREEVSKYVAPPDLLPPHCTGGAVDVTLATAEGAELDMGTRVNASPEESAGACYMRASNISRQAKTNRALLSASMEAAGLVNYPTEWWHWSYGDRYWAFVAHRPAAIYGAAVAPSWH